LITTPQAEGFSRISIKGSRLILGNPARGAQDLAFRPKSLPAPLSRAMTTLALYGACLPSLLPQPQMAPFTLAMMGVLHIQAAGLRPQTVAGLALCHRLPFTPDVALSLVVVMALGAGHAPGFVHPVAELHRGLMP
jgi:hypothetical protein